MVLNKSKDTYFLSFLPCILYNCVVALLWLQSGTGERCAAAGQRDRDLVLSCNNPPGACMAAPFY